MSDAIQQQFQGFTFQPTEAIAGSMAAGSLMNNTRMEAVAGSVRPAGAMRRN